MIDKQTAADLLDNLVGMVSDTQDNDYDSALRMGIEALNADAVEVVRCKDCYHYYEERWLCSVNVSEFEPTDFCSYGERKDG